MYAIAVLSFTEMVRQRVSGLYKVADKVLQILNRIDGRGSNVVENCYVMRLSTIADCLYDNMTKTNFSSYLTRFLTNSGGGGAQPIIGGGGLGPNIGGRGSSPSKEI